MRIKSITLQNIRGFESLNLDFSKTINLLVGPNNSGKSTILKSMLRWQRQDALIPSDTTVGQIGSIIRLSLDDHKNSDFGHLEKVEISIKNGAIVGLQPNSSRFTLQECPSIEPKNIFYLFLSTRKVAQFNESINAGVANNVDQNFSNLYSKIDRLNTPQHDGHNEYIESCRNIVGLEIASVASPGGKQAVQIIRGQEQIPLAAMGEGVSNLLGLITDLCVAEGKIFLIEEPENDIHPLALKALMNLIIKKSLNNQFFISTHSQIVVKYLGGVDASKIFSVKRERQDLNRPKLHLSSVVEVVSPEDRRSMLEDLGYEFFDIDLWNGWLFLEESSAEELIRTYFLKWFLPNLYNKVRTFSAGGRDKISQKFDDFNKLFVFLQLTPAYKNKVWVMIDGGENEKVVIERLKDMYTKSGWSAQNFSQFDQHDFEKYYPAIFHEKVNNVLAIADSEKKRGAKTDLLKEVLEWIRKDEEHAKREFSVSATAVIEKLKLINC